MNSKSLIVLIAVLVAVAGVAYWTTRSPSASEASQSIPPVAADTPRATPAYRIGPANARMVVEEYSDYECPFCARAFVRTGAEIKAFIEKRGDIGYAFYDLAGPSHRNAGLAAIAARCAGTQGAYQAAETALFERQKEWAAASEGIEPVDVVEPAVADRAALRACIQRDSAATEEILLANLRHALAQGVKSTPTWLVRRADGATTALTGSVDSARIAAALR